VFSFVLLHAVLWHGILPHISAQIVFPTFGALQRYFRIVCFGVVVTSLASALVGTAHEQEQLFKDILTFDFCQHALKMN